MLDDGQIAMLLANRRCGDKSCREANRINVVLAVLAICRQELKGQSQGCIDRMSGDAC